MRIVAGLYGGRTVEVPPTGDLRPTQDRVRESLFGILAPELGGCAFLDLFAGSGAVGIEALSRGAASATLVECDPRHAATARRNIGKFSAAGAQVVCADAFRWIRTYAGPGFGIVFADPPYALGGEIVSEDFLSTLAARGVVRPGGLFVAETASAPLPAGISGWDMLRDRMYGKSRIRIFRRMT